MPQGFTLDETQTREQMERRVMPVCSDCKHWHVGEDTCDAFLRGIPEEIFFYGAKHNRSVPGDNGITYEEAR